MIMRTIQNIFTYELNPFTYRLIFLTQLTFGLMQQNILGEDCGFSAENLRSTIVYYEVYMYVTVTMVW